MPGSAVVIAVVRRVTLWHDDGSGHLVRRWAGRLHRQGSLLVLAWAILVFTSRHGVAVLLNQQSGIGIAAILAAAGFFVLLSLDRGLLQAHRAYRPLAVNLLVEMGVRLVAVLVLVLAGFGPSGAAVGILIGEVVAAGHARWAAVRAWSGGQGRLHWAAGSWVAAVRPDPVLHSGGSARRDVVVDLVVASISLSMVAVLQNVDVLVVGRDNPTHSGAYAAVSVTSKAIVFGAIVLGGYLLPEAAIRWRQGGHALRQLAVVLVLLAVPSVLLLGIAVLAPAGAPRGRLPSRLHVRRRRAGTPRVGHDPAERLGRADHVPLGGGAALGDRHPRRRRLRPHARRARRARGTAGDRVRGPGGAVRSSSS